LDGEKKKRLVLRPTKTLLSEKEKHLVERASVYKSDFVILSAADQRSNYTHTKIKMEIFL